MPFIPPTDYMLCQNSGCDRAETCLRYRCLLDLTDEPVSVRVLNPRRYPQGEAACDYYCTTEKIRIAWGIKHIFNGLPYESARNIKSELLSHFGRTKYYRFFREEVPLLPADQKVTRAIFRKNGVESEPAYTRFSEAFDW
ncbi:MAG: hypothetical protein K2H73_09965 [Treponemataceae bacterium]|nr:hypothetical protein [Treponemataceae bacterium]